MNKTFQNKLLSKSKNLILFFLLLFSIKPILDLYWQENIGGVSVIWLIYPPIYGIYFALILESLANKKIDEPILLNFAFIFSLLINAIFFGLTDYSSYSRILTSLFVIFFFQRIIAIGPSMKVAYLAQLYSLGLLIPIYIAILQINGSFPIYSFDDVDGVSIGRISGGYSKPNNFAAYIFPVYLFFLFQLSGCVSWLKRITYLILIVSIFILIKNYVNHRTFTNIYVLIVLIFYLPFLQALMFHFFHKKIYIYCVLVVFFILSVFHDTSFVSEWMFSPSWGMRGRIFNWVIHLREWINSDLRTIAFGKGFVYAEAQQTAGFVLEFHSEFGRILETYGILGLSAYFIGLNRVFQKVLVDFKSDRRKMSLGLSSMTALFLYSITNEAGHFPPVFWSLSIWLLLLYIYPFKEES